jgi:cell division septation protein DedD
MPHLAAATAVHSEVGPWNIQIGAFRDRRAVEAQLRAIARKVPRFAELAPAAEAWGQLTRARVGGIADRTEADDLCALIIDTGSDCLVVAPVN